LRSIPESDKSKNTVNRLLEAARQEFARNGYEGVRTPAVARRAGVSVGTLYRYFEDKRDLLYKLTEELVERDEALVIGEGGDSAGNAREQALLEGMIRYLDLLIAQRDLIKAFVEASYRDPEFMVRGWKWELRAMEVLEKYIGHIAGDRITNKRAAAIVIQHAIFRTILVGDLYGRAGKTRVPDREIRRQLLTMIGRYLGLPQELLEAHLNSKTRTKPIVKG
jgi:AcrR family transcriptional regulator